MPGAPMLGLDPIILLDAVLGTPENFDHWEKELLAYSASSAPMPRSKKEKPSVSPSDRPRGSRPRSACGPRPLSGASSATWPAQARFLERLAELLKTLDDEAADDVDDEPARAVTTDQATPGGTGRQRAPRRPRSTS